MAELKFRVQADYEKVQRLRDEITKLKQEIKGVDAIQDPTAFNKLNSKLQQTSKELNSVTNNIAQASASVETGFKQKIFAASQSVNDFTEKIIAQKAVVRDIAADVSRLGEAYRSAARTSPMMAEDKLAEWKAAKKALDEEKAALFGLTQEQANARLSVKKLRDEYALLRQEGAGTEETMNMLTGKLKQMSGMLLGGMGLKELASRIISVRAEFESMETSLKVLLGGNEERLNNIMGQIKEYALASPLNTKDMVGAVQMMTSFGIEAEKSIDYLKAIGDVSMGDAGKFNSLALAFSQMSSAGKLMGQDLMQMVNAGFNPLEEIARKTGKSIGELKEEMSKGAITSKMVQDAFISATSAGGKFYGMSSEGAKTLNGQISMLQESFDNMFNEIGGKGEGVVMTAVQMATKLVENYEQVGRVLLGLVETYGAYRVGLAVATVAQNGHTFAMTLARAQILITQKAQALLNITMLANPYVLVASAIGVMIGALIMQRTQTDLVNDATKRYNEKKQEVIELEKRHNEEIQKLCNVAADDTLSTDNRRLALVKLEQKYPSIFKKYDTEAQKLAHIRDINAEIVELENKRSFANPKNEISRIDNRLKELDSLSKKKRLHEGSGTDNMGQQQMVEYAGLTKTEEAEKTALLKQKANLKKTIDKDKANNYLANVKEVDNASLARQINERNNLLAKMQTSGKKYGTVRAGGAKGVFNKDELDGQLKILRDEQARRQNKGTKKTKAELSEDKKRVQGELDGLTTDDAKGKKGAALRKKLRDIQAQEDLYSSSYDTKNKKSADDKKEKERKQRAKDAKEQKRANIAYNEANKQLEDTLSQSYIDSLEEGSEKTLAAMKLTHRKEIEQLEKQKQEYLDKKKEANGGKNASLSRDEQKKFDDIRKNIDIKYSNETKGFYASQLQSMYDYLKEYGTVQQQMYAIAKEYDEKIAKEKDENRKKILQKEKESALAKTNSNSLAMNIDWGATFGGVGKVLKDIAKETLKEVEQYMRSAEFKSLSPSDKKAYTDLRDKLRSEDAGEITSPFKFSQWGDIEKQTRAYQDSVRRLKEKTEAHANAVEELKVAEKELSLATDETTRSIAQSKVDKAQVEVRNTASEMNDAIADKDDKKANLTDSTGKAVQGLDNFSSALQTMSNGTLKGFADGLANLIKSIGGKGGAGGIIGAIGGKAGGLIGAILQIIDALGDDPAKFIKGILDRVGKVVETILAELPKLIVDILKGVLNIIVSIFNGIGRLFTGSGNEKGMENEIKRLSKSNERLAQSIDDLSKSIGKKDNTNEQSIDAYKKALKEELDWERNQRNAINKRASEWGRHHSFNYDANDSSWHIWGKLNKILEKIGSKARVYNATDVWKLSPEEMKELRAQAMDAWREFFDSNKGLKSPEDLVNQYIERAGKQEELSATLNEKLTGYSWDGFMDSYKSALKNLESTTKDFADNINDLISNALIDSFTNEKLKPQIDELYKYIAKAAENGLDDREIAYIRKTNEDIANQGIEQRNIWEQAGLIKKKGDEEQNATANGVSSITFEQANNIVALTTAGNISRDQIKERLSLMNATMDDIRALMSQTFSSMPNYTNSTHNILNDSYTPKIQVSFPKEELQNINGKIGTILAVVDEMRSHGAESLMEQKALSRDTEKIVMGNKEMLSCVNDFRRDFNKQY
nr:MAG TPA: tail tape measure protein [Bacteriophage sp.]